MKKNIVAPVLVILLLVTACAEDDATCDKDAVIARIEGLETAINNNSYEAFLENVHSDTNQFDSFDQEALDALTSDGADDYDFHDYDVSCDGEDRANVDCTAATGFSDYETAFDVRTENSDWYIYLWTEEGDVMFDRYSPPAR